MLFFNAGLGVKKLSLSLDNDSDDINYYILESFPKLQGAGGYELLRATSSRCLEIIPTPPDGYTVTYLKDVVQQAKIYVRYVHVSWVRVYYGSLSLSDLKFLGRNILCLPTSIFISCSSTY